MSTGKLLCRLRDIEEEAERLQEWITELRVELEYNDKWDDALKELESNRKRTRREWYDWACDVQATSETQKVFADPLTPSSFTEKELLGDFRLPRRFETLADEQESTLAHIEIHLEPHGKYEVVRVYPDKPEQLEAKTILHASAYDLATQIARKEKIPVFDYSWENL